MPQFLHLQKAGEQREKVLPGGSLSSSLALRVFLLAKKTQRRQYGLVAENGA